MTGASARPTVRTSEWPLSGPAQITLTFEDGKIAGSAGCNQYFANVDESSPGRVTFGPVGATRKACSPERMDAEQLFVDRLGKTSS